MVPKHWRAAGLPPQNLLFPTWLPGTAQNFTPVGNARQTSLAWFLGAEFGDGRAVGGRIARCQAGVVGLGVVTANQASRITKSPDRVIHGKWYQAANAMTTYPAAFSYGEDSPSPLGCN